MSADHTQPGVQQDVVCNYTFDAQSGLHSDLINEGPFATVSRTWTTIKDGVPQWVVVKSATTLRKFSREPHDIVKELRLLSSMAHMNIVLIMGSFRDDEQNILSIYMPYLPISFSSIISSPFFSPHTFPPLHTPNDETRRLQEDQFNVVAKSIMIQTLNALAFLHDEKRRIGHRDIKPENIMLTDDGCVKLIDFGVSWKEKESDLERNHDLWPEHRGKLYFEVSTGAYRAPELLFGTRNYDHSAIDIWSLGATFAGFFTALRLASDEEDDGDDDDDDDDDEDTETDQNPEDIPPEPFVVPKYLRIGYPGAQWRRDTLFNGERGEIGLAWSIFKILGTPNEQNWPDFEELPGATSVVFNVVPSVPLLPLLPNLPPSSIAAHPSPPATSLSGSVRLSPLLDLILKFLAYPPSSRLRAEDAMRHPWFTDCNSVLLIPEGYTVERNAEALNDVLVHTWKGKTLGEWLAPVLVAVPMH